MKARLHLNENHFVDSSLIFSEISKILTCNLYPDIQYIETKRLLSNWLDVEKSRIVLGNGSTDIIQRIFSSMVRGNNNIIFPWPSYILYSELEIKYSVQAYRTPLNEKKQVDLDDILTTLRINDNIKFIIICNPNNPTGTILKRSDIQSFMQKIPLTITVLIDEAYIEYAKSTEEYTALKLTSEFNNLIVCRTFSKLYGLAALRIGYAVCSEKMAQILENEAPNWNITGVAVAAVEYVIFHLDYYRKIHSKNLIEMHRIFKKLLELNIAVEYSHTNYFYLENIPIPKIQEACKKNFLMVQYINDIHYPAIRFSISEPKINDLFLKILYEELKK
jgi:histidinol-phosphate aminotransferase